MESVPTLAPPEASESDFMHDMLRDTNRLLIHVTIPAPQPPKPHPKPVPPQEPAPVPLPSPDPPPTNPIPQL